MRVGGGGWRSGVELTKGEGGERRCEQRIRWMREKWRREEGNVRLGEGVVEEGQNSWRTEDEGNVKLKVERLGWIKGMWAGGGWNRDAVEAAMDDELVDELVLDWWINLLHYWRWLRDWWMNLY